MANLFQDVLFDEAKTRELVEQYGSPLLLLDCDKLADQYRQLSAALPGVGLYYAVKAFPHAAIVNKLNQLGACFDIASTGEINLLRKQKVNPRNTIHTHPIKKDKDIKDALRFGCSTFVVDNHAEISKFRKYAHRVGLLLRVAFRSPDCAVDLSRKFGCSSEEVPALIKEANELGLHVKGLSFHVGSQSLSPSTHVAAIEACTRLIEEYEVPIRILDIGGGFPVDYDHGNDIDIHAFCAPIRAALAKLPEHVEVIAEPGRFLIAPAAASITTVAGKAMRGDQPWYYLDDGVYGMFSGRIYDHARYPLHVFRKGPTRPSALVGPTCDSIDVVEEAIELPELEVGDLVVGRMMGAYTAATASTFNSLPIPRIVVFGG
ncbi:MAG TPA: type III PLP-dependent enzyme [Pseudomonadales bacterium]|nr:type III PLP-dependent enzyme [Pseudomonadales bacterium]